MGSVACLAEFQGRVFSFSMELPDGNAHLPEVPQAKAGALEFWNCETLLVPQLGTAMSLWGDNSCPPQASQPEHHDAEFFKVYAAGAVVVEVLKEPLQLVPLQDHAMLSKGLVEGLQVQIAVGRCGFLEDRPVGVHFGCRQELSVVDQVPCFDDHSPECTELVEVDCSFTFWVYVFDGFFNFLLRGLHVLLFSNLHDGISADAPLIQHVVQGEPLFELGKDPLCQVVVVVK
mmetsp:Transcript_52205/g.93657  ORF Transcript_52205/g.93657 Transcript_52205/m.93657 type:complete len:231 (-) Transcript_52205:376-1068(-)